MRCSPNPGIAVPFNAAVTAPPHFTTRRDAVTQGGVTIPVPKRCWIPAHFGRERASSPATGLPAVTRSGTGPPVSGVRLDDDRFWRSSPPSQAAAGDEARSNVRLSMHDCRWSRT